MNLHEPQESIAIVGMAGRFPQAGNLAEFWRNLRDGVEGVSFFRDDEVEWLPLEHAPDLRDPRFVRARAVLERAEWFDAGFFGINPQEARVMDPQHRVFLECCWEALEHAGCNPETAAGMIGVFAGASLNTYLFTNLLTNRELVARLGVFPTLLGNDGDFLPTRVSYKLNLRGPSINVQTACSTSLVAVCLAAQSLLSYRCDLALAGGVSITFPQRRGQQHLEGGILSPDGHCRAFDAQAGGTVLGDGAGVVVLKRLSEAIADGDAIAAVIKGTAVNNDGALKIGYTAPSSEGQAEAIALAHAEAGFAPETVDYVEAHGTGTPIGDPIEIAGLTKAFGLGAEQGQFCALGSVKTNIGHLDVGAGVAGLIKTVLALQHEAIPPSLHFEAPNPKIDFAHSPFFVNRTLRPWPRGGRPRRAGVSSFGIGGTNAHVALEEAPAPLPTTPAAGPHLLLLSAKTPRALDAAAENLARHLELHPGSNLADVAFTLQAGRKAFPHRRAIVCHDVSDAVRALRDPAAGLKSPGSGAGEPPRIAFLFPGQGAQAVDMARGLYETDEDFRARVDQSCVLLQPRLGLDLRTVLFPASAAEAGAASARLGETWLTQPALFVIEHALAERWRQWGIEPEAMLGHSLGEYVAACLAGVFSLEDALAVVAERGRLMQAQRAGAMLAVRAPDAKVREFLDTNLALAAVNAPGLCVVSGPFDAIDALERRLAAGAIVFKRLATSHAFHSAMMEPALRPFADCLRRVRMQAPARRWISNVTGTWITAEQATDPEYWVAQLRGTVRFSAGLGQLLASGVGVFLEVGPGTTLTGLARQHTAGGAPGVAIASLGGSRGAASDRAAQWTALGELWVAGAPVAWRSGVYRGQRRQIVPLPTYPFERERYWIEPGPGWGPGGSNGAPVDVSDDRRHTEMAAGPTLALPARPAAGVAGPSHAPNGRNGHGTTAALQAMFAELSGSELSGARPEATFYELGFDSLFLTQCSTEVNRRFGVEVTIRKLREELTTFEKLAAFVDAQLGRQAEANRAAREGAVALPAGGKESAPTTRVAEVLAATPALASGGLPVADVAAAPRWVPVTQLQREIWQAVKQGPSVAGGCHEAATLHLRGQLDESALQRALRQLALRHEALRTTFAATGEGQWIAADAEVELPRQDLSLLEPDVRAARMSEFLELHRQRPFDPVCGPLWRAALLRIEPEQHALTMVMHQLVGDANSLALLVREWGALYTAESTGRLVAFPPVESLPAPAASDAPAPGPEFSRAERIPPGWPLASSAATSPQTHRAGGKIQSTVA